MGVVPVRPPASPGTSPSLGVVPVRPPASPGTSPSLGVVVLVSGGGSNLQALIDAQDGGLPIAIRAVVSNEPDAYALERARAAGIPAEVLSHRRFPSREAYDTALAELIDGFDPGLVVLAGFMRILTPGFAARYRGRMLNIHPSLLPRHRGLHTHRRALDAGEQVHGASVHFVTPELDSGPVILQAEVPIVLGDTPEVLAARVLEREHIIYPCVVGWFAAGRLHLDDADRPVLDGRVLERPLLLGPETPCPGWSSQAWSG
jgi:phosphoribosylglycinamide formyltransferase-1